LSCTLRGAGLTLPRQGGGVLKLKLYEEVDKTENDIGIDSCCHIIQNYPKSSLQSSFQKTDWNGFKNIEKTEEKKTDENEVNGFGNPEHGNEKTHHFIDNDPPIIFFPKNYLCIL